MWPPEHQRGVALSECLRSLRFSQARLRRIWVRSDIASTEEVGRASLPPLPFSVLACTRAALTGSSQGIFELLLFVSEKPAVSRLTTRRTSVISSIDDIHGVLTADSLSFYASVPSLLAPMNLLEYSLMFLPYVCVAWPEEESNYRLRLTSYVLQTVACRPVEAVWSHSQVRFRVSSFSYSLGIFVYQGFK
ncbi:hypothetical protein HID58_008868 [Brassica napus]|uniref:Uncharacterized protein n=1 Tax=Brassica napus TaxID=3708 RepID=A0ABQ8DQX7_BRANA|nr:hypothetical protein HID58_008868 [Brassica napus]